MVVIDEEEYIDLDAEVIEVDEKGRPVKSKFKKDKFYMKEMDVLKTQVTEEEAEEIRDRFRETLPDQFIENNNEIGCVSLSARVPRPDSFVDTEFMGRVMEMVNTAEVRMEEAEMLQKKRRKERLKEFDNYLKEYLNRECGAKYKLS